MLRPTVYYIYSPRPPLTLTSSGYSTGMYVCINMYSAVNANNGRGRWPKPKAKATASALPGREPAAYCTERLLYFLYYIWFLVLSRFCKA